MKLCWKPTIDTTADLNVNDAFKAMMEEAGYRLPCSLTDEDLPVLRGMSAVAEPGYRVILKELVRLIIENDSIDIWVDETP